MRRHEYAREQQLLQQQQAAYQQELLLRRKLLYSAQQGANVKRLPPELFERRYSFESQPDVPIYAKFLYPQNAMAPIGLLNDSLDSLATDIALRQRRGQHYYYDESDATDMEPDAAAKVVRNLTALGRFLEMLQNWPLPRLSFNTACICFLLGIFIAPRQCAQSLLFPIFRLFFGTLYPAYASYKAVRTKNVKEYVKWMMYWIVFAFFTCIETFTDIFMSWFPFYYEVKVVIVLWLLSPATKGSSTLYRKFVHPMLTRREQEIDEYLNQAKERGYSAVLQLGTKGVNYATNVIMQTAIKGGGNLVQSIKRSYSLSDLSEPDTHRTADEVDEVMALRPQQRLLRARQQVALGRSSSGTRHSTGMYFAEVELSDKRAGDFNYNIRSTDDISSGYSSAEPISGGGGGVGGALSRTSSMTNASKTRLKSKRHEMPYTVATTTTTTHTPDRVTQSAQYPPAYLIDDMRDEVFLTNEAYYQQENWPERVASKNLKLVDGAATVETVEPELAQGTTALSEAESVKTLSVDRDVDVDVDEDNDDDFFEAYTSDVSEPSIATSVTSAADVVKSSKMTSDTDTNEQTAASLSTDVPGPVTRIRPVSPRDLRATLEQIKDDFRAQIETPDGSTNGLIKAQHKKGKAPPPPVPPRPVQPFTQVGVDKHDHISIASTCPTASTAERTPSPTPARTTGIGNFFKTIKANMLRRSNNNNDNDDDHDDANDDSHRNIASHNENISASRATCNQPSKETDI